MRTVRSKAAAALVLSTTIGLAGCGGTPAQEKPSPGALQLRPVLAHGPSDCPVPTITENPSASAGTSLPAPNSSAPGPCVRLGAAVLAVSTVESVDLGRSPAGLVLVSVRLTVPEQVQYRRVVSHLQATQAMAWVALGQVLSLPTVDQLRQPRVMSGTVQVAGGLDGTDRRPQELARALQSPLHGVGATSTSATAGTTTVALSELAGSGLPVSAVSGHRVVRQISFDEGDLVIDPPRTAHALVTLGHAEKIVAAAMTASPGSYNPALVALGRVTLRHEAAGLPRYAGRLAWVALVGPQVGISCPGMMTGGSGPEAAPSVSVVILDAQSADAVLHYRSRGAGPCGGPAVGPTLERAAEVLSVPWTAMGEHAVAPGSSPFPPGAPVPPHQVDWVIRYTIPACGTQFDSGTYAFPPGTVTLYIDVTVPISAPARCAAARTITTTWGPESVDIGQARHGPVGIAGGAEL